MYVNFDFNFIKPFHFCLGGGKISPFYYKSCRLLLRKGSSFCLVSVFTTDFAINIDYVLIFSEIYIFFKKTMHCSKNERDRK